MLFLVTAGTAPESALAQPAPLQPAPAIESPPATDHSPEVAVPGFWDPKRRPERPDITRLPTQIRFVTTEDYPPFSFRGEDGRPTGFNVDIARAICTELAITCTLEIMPFADLAAALEEGRADAAIAGIAISTASRESLDFSDRYFRFPARFVVRSADAVSDVRPGALTGKTIGVQAGTAHEAYLRNLFGEATIRPYPDPDALRTALQKSEVDLIFGDGVQLALWLNGTSSAGCCTFVGGPFTESLYFGEGMGIAVKRGSDALRQSLNYALAQLWEEGAYTDLYLRWFPISVY